MTKKLNNNGAHLTIYERDIIEVLLKNRDSLKTISENILKSPRTISREIRIHREFDSKEIVRTF